MINYDDKKREILVALKDMLIDEEIAAKYTNKGEEGYPLDMVNALIDEMTDEGDPGIAEFFFMPAHEGMEEYGIFQSVVTFADEIEKEAKETFDKVASIINFYLETGAFCGDLDLNNYSLKMSVMLPLDADMNVLKDMVQLNASQAILTASAYCNLFLKVAMGAMSLDEVEALIKG